MQSIMVLWFFDFTAFRKNNSATGRIACGPFLSRLEVFEVFSPVSTKTKLKTEHLFCSFDCRIGSEMLDSVGPSCYMQRWQLQLLQGDCGALATLLTL